MLNILTKNCNQWHACEGQIYKRPENPAMSFHIIEIETCTQYYERNNFITPVVISSIQVGAVRVVKVPRQKGRRKIRSTYRIATCGRTSFSPLAIHGFLSKMKVN